MFLDFLTRRVRQLPSWSHRLREKFQYFGTFFVLFVYFQMCSPLITPAQAPPYPPSPVVESISWDFDNLTRLAPGSDLWPTTWAVDDNLYTSWGDGGGFGGTNSDGRVSLGFARIEGSPESFKGINVWGGKNAENPATFTGKSGGILSVDGTLYAWLNTQQGNPPNFRLIWSSDLGASWQEANWTFPSNVFAPSTILNFGKDYDGAPDDFIYVYGGPWGITQHVYLARVPKDQIKSRAAYQFFQGFDANDQPTWSNNIGQLEPVFTDPNLSNEFNGALKASVVCAPGLKRYLMTVPHGGVGKLGIFDAPEPWGPWTTVAYYEDWGSFGISGEALIYSFPAKWISSDGTTMWLVFSGLEDLDSFNLVKATLTLKPAVNSASAQGLPASRQTISHPQESTGSALSTLDDDGEFDESAYLPIIFGPENEDGDITSCL